MAIFSAIAATAWFAGLSGIAATAATAAVAIGQAVTWSLASALIFPTKVSRQSMQATVTESARPRIRGWGRNLTGGVKVLFEANDDRLYQCVVMHHGAIDGLIRFWIDGEPVDTGADGYVARYKYLFFRDGSGAGGDYEELRVNFPELWTAQHRLQGQATFLSVWGDPSDGNFAKVFPKGPQTTVQAEIRASRVPDFNGAMIYSQNAGLCIRDFLTHADGWNIPMARLDADSWIRFAGICAEEVPLARGGTEPRYDLSGFYTLEDPLKEVAARMLATCDGQIYETAEGTIGILGGAWSEPDVTLTDADILSIEMQDGYDPMKVYNVLQGSFVSPAHAYQSIDVAELRDEVALAREEPRTDRLEVEMCPSGTQLQRLMKIRMAKARRAMTGKIRTNLVGLKARFPKGDGVHAIRIVAEEFGLDGIFEVTSHVFNIADGWCEIGIASLEAPAYAWNAATDEKPLPVTYAAIGTPDNTQPPPQNPVIAQKRVRVSGDVQAVALTVSVDDPGKDSLTFLAQIASGYIEDVTPEDREAAGLPDYTWTDMAAGRRNAESGVLDDGMAYTIRIKWRGRTDWVKAGSVLVSANPDKPPAPTRFTGVVTGQTVALDWIAAPTGFFRTQIWRGATTDFSKAVFVANVAGVPGKVSDVSDQPSRGTWRYWAVTINASAVPSDPAGPITVTIT